jgi:hypothetical protein
MTAQAGRAATLLGGCLPAGAVPDRLRRPAPAQPRICHLFTYLAYARAYLAGHGMGIAVAIPQRASIRG